MLLEKRHSNTPKTAVMTRIFIDSDKTADCNASNITYMALIGMDHYTGTSAPVILLKSAAK